MASKTITDLTADATPETGDLLVTVDISDTTDSANGTNKKVTIANLMTLGISDTAYAGSWNAVTTIAPSKNAVYDQMELKSPLASPTFTGVPAAPTAAVDTNTTQIATTAFVLAQAATQAEIETASSTSKFITAGRAQFHPSSAKFWTFVNGGGTPAMAANYNTTSVADTGVGFMTVTIGTDFSSATWCPVGKGIGNARTVTTATMQWVSAAMAAGTIELTNADLSATPVVEDVVVGWAIAGFGDQA